MREVEQSACGRGDRDPAVARELARAEASRSAQAHPGTNPGISTGDRDLDVATRGGRHLPQPRVRAVAENGLWAAREHRRQLAGQRWRRLMSHEEHTPCTRCRRPREILCAIAPRPRPVAISWARVMSPYWDAAMAATASSGLVTTCTAPHASVRKGCVDWCTILVYSSTRVGVRKWCVDWCTILVHSSTPIVSRVWSVELCRSARAQASSLAE